MDGRLFKCVSAHSSPSLTTHTLHQPNPTRKQVHAVLDKVKDFSEGVRSGQIRGATGKRIRNIVAVGIGGSYLGPACIHEVFKTEEEGSVTSHGFCLRFLSNVDPVDVSRAQVIGVLCRPLICGAGRMRRLRACCALIVALAFCCTHDAGGKHRRRSWTRRRRW